MTDFQITIEIPQLPPVEYSPNWRGFWGKRYRAGQRFSQETFLCVVQTKSSLSPEVLSSLPLEKVEISLLFVVKDDRIRDVDNWVARMKPGIDALCNAGLIVGDDYKHLAIKEVNFEVNPQQAPKTLIKLQKKELS